MHKLLIILGLLTLTQQSAFAQTTQPADAAALYLQAAKILSADDARNIMSPAASPELFRDYPPMSDEWLRIEKQDYDLHAPVRQLVHEAALLNSANWPPFDQKHIDIHYLNDCRNVANEIADAALYQSLILHDQPAAFTSAADELHLVDMLENTPGENLIRLLVGEGIEALDTTHLLVIIANAKITDDPANTQDLPLATATQWIARLLDQPGEQAVFDQAMKGEPRPPTTNPAAKAALDAILKPTLDMVIRGIHRIQTQRDLAAMSLAAHVYQFKHHRWPQNLQELATELPTLPIDPWGDGNQTLGYALIKAALPDGSDRPLVYSRFGANAGLFFRTDHPIYQFDSDYNSKLPLAQQNLGGQFIDIAPWSPPQTKNPQPTTQPLR